MPGRGVRLAMRRSPSSPPPDPAEPETIVSDLTPLDRRLLAELQRDARTPVAALVERCGASRASVQRRLKALREGGTIAREVAIVDRAALGRTRRRRHPSRRDLATPGGRATPTPLRYRRAMARSRRGRAKSRSSPARAKAETARDPARLEADALRALERGRHRDAVAACKALLKGATAPAATEAAEALLARAYAGRAAELADKAMFVEALAILEQRAGLAGGSGIVPDEVLWSARAGRPERAARLLRERGAELDAAGALAGLRERLAALILSGDDGLLAALDPDDPLARDHAASDAMLRAFSAGDDAAQDAAARRVAWRSPYRGLRRLLDAWRRRADDPAGAADALARLGDDSPFGVLGQRLAALAALDDEPPVVAGRALRLEPRQRRLAVAVLGWPARLERLLVDATAAGDAPDAKARLQLVLEHADAFDPDDARRAARALSATASTKPLRAATDRFGAPTRLERARHAALRAERTDDDPFSIDEAWLDVLELLPSADDPGFAPGSDAPVAAAESFGGAFRQERDRQLAAALVNRRVADLRARPPFGSPTDPLAIDALWESVALDPHDAAATARLISTLREADDLKGARAATDEALERLPNDAAVLLEAVRTALAGNAFKKAERLAGRLLEIDPVNAPVKALMLDAALAHARKQIKAGKLDLARRQLDDVAVRVRGGEARGRIDVLHGLLEMIDESSGNEADGRRRLRAGHDALGGTPVGHFRVCLEAVRLGRDPRRACRWAGLTVPGRVEDDARVVDLVRALGAESEEPDVLHRALEPLAKALRGAAKRRWTIEEFESLCETLLRARQYAPLETFAEVAVRRHPHVPAFVYLHECARARGDWRALDESSLSRLRSAARHAERVGDARTGLRIDELVSPPDVFGGPGGPGGFGAPPEVPPEMIALLAAVGAEGIEELERAARRGEDPRRTIGRLLDRLGPDEAESLRRDLGFDDPTEGFAP